MNRTMKGLLSGLVLAGLTACSGGAGDSAATPSSASALTISGGFSGASIQAFAKPEIGAFAATDYTVLCSTFEEPPKTGYGPLDLNGAFSLTIAGAAGQPIDCVLRKSGRMIAIFTFSGTQNGMTANAEGGGLAVNDGATVITLPTDIAFPVSSTQVQTISVSASAIVQNSSAPPAVVWADPTGTWTISQVCHGEDVSGTLTTACGAPDGVNIPTSVYMKQLQATSGTEARTGLSIWRSLATRTGCGDKEGITLEPGWTATGGWAGAMTGGVSMDISTDMKRQSLAASATVSIWDGAVQCDKVKTTGGASITATTKCSEVDWAGTYPDKFGNSVAGGWGMNAKACELYCVTGALSNGDGAFDWGSATCKKRYRSNWAMSIELASDTDYNAGNGTTAGVFSAGTCSDTAFDGCKDSGSGKELLKLDKAEDQFVIGELFISGNIGTVVSKEHFSNNFDNGNHTGSITCGGTFVEKLTVKQISATSAEVISHRTFIADESNVAGCTTNEGYIGMAKDVDYMTIKLTK